MTDVEESSDVTVSRNLAEPIYNITRILQFGLVRMDIYLKPMHSCQVPVLFWIQEQRKACLNTVTKSGHLSVHWHNCKACVIRTLYIGYFIGHRWLCLLVLLIPLKNLCGLINLLFIHNISIPSISFPCHCKCLSWVPLVGQDKFTIW